MRERHLLAPSRLLACLATWLVLFFSPNTLRFSQHSLYMSLILDSLRHVFHANLLRSVPTIYWYFYSSCNSFQLIHLIIVQTDAYIGEFSHQPQPSVCGVASRFTNEHSLIFVATSVLFFHYLLISYNSLLCMNRSRSPVIDQAAGG